ncbi:MAG TPA: AgmX/PglI C-terminal domain-containing protein [Polyangia bacterium]|nr:AgmX/PglI C-terminal domain-containing protein [Polyangia bacterium]
MQPLDRTHRARPQQPAPTPPARAAEVVAPERVARPLPAAAPLHLAGPALMVTARFRDIALASRLLRAAADAAFTIGDGRRVDAPVNPAWLPSPDDGDAHTRHELVAAEPGGFAVNLTAAMRAQLWTAVQRLPIGPDLGRAESPLTLPPGSQLRIVCGEVTFELHPAEPAAAIPRPWLPAQWRTGALYLLGVALALGAILGLAHLVPGDPRALSLDALDSSIRWARMIHIPLALNDPAVNAARTMNHTSGSAGGPAAAGPAGAAGTPKTRERMRRMAIKGTAPPQDARAATAQVHASSLLAVLDGPRTADVSEVLAPGSALGADARSAMGELVATTIGDSFGHGGLGTNGTGAYGAGTHEGTIGTGALQTVGLGHWGSGNGPGVDYGANVGQLRARHAVAPDVIPSIASVRGSLDREIIRRIVRRHLNEVRYCYNQGLVAKPSLAGRLVVQFAIAPTGVVQSSLMQSSSLDTPAVESCVVTAVRRWEFPQPAGGGYAFVSYPFTFSPAGD